MVSPEDGLWKKRRKESLSRILSRILRILFVLWSLVLGFGVSAQPPEKKAYLEVRSQILQKAFGPAPPRPLGSLVYVVRMLPSFHPEAEIRITFGQRDEPAQVEYLKAQQQLDAVWSGSVSPVPDATAIVERMQIRRREIKIAPAVAERWAEAFRVAFNESASAFTEASQTIQLDGTRYELTLEGELFKINFSILGSEVGEDVTSDIPIIKWIDRVRRDIEEQSKE